MKKILLLAGALALFSLYSAAQTGKGTKFNIALDGDLPIGQASDLYSFGMGITAKFEVPIVKNTYLTANMGYTNLRYSSNWKWLFSTSSRNFIPIEVGGRYYLTSNFYGEGQIGTAIGTNRGDANSFAYTPGVGIILPAGNGNAFDIGFRFESWNKNGSLNFFGLRAAYKFGL